MSGTKYDSLIGKLREKDGKPQSMYPLLFSGVGGPNGVVTPTKPGDLYIDLSSGYYRYNSDGTINGWLRFMVYSASSLMKITYGSGSPIVVASKVGDLYYDNDTGELYMASLLLEWKPVEQILPLVFGSGTGVGTVTLTTTISNIAPLSAVSPSMVGEIYFDTTNFVLYEATGLTNADWTEIGYTQFGALITLIGTLHNTTYISGSGSPYGIVDPTPYGAGVWYTNISDGTLWLNVTNTTSGWIQLNIII